jgi:hypothetical protein
VDKIPDACALSDDHVFVDNCCGLDGDFVHGTPSFHTELASK